MGGSCDSDCNSCVPADFCHQWLEDEMKLEIAELKKQNKALVKNLSMIQEYYGVQKSDYFDDGSWHNISEKESKQITRKARIFHGDGKL